MYEKLFERWQYESEGDSLEFKKEQYRFKGACDNDKSELLKDIVAMVNSWRSVDGYIVIGIEERPQKPNILHGVALHIDDATIQQFVNSKLHRACTFEYKTYTKDENTYGIIRIPLQKRPVYLSRNYGKLKANTVYVRRGSSTGEATPDEISKMGIDLYDLSRKAAIEIGFYDKSKDNIVGSELTFETTYYDVIDKIPDYSNRESFGLTSRDYYRDYVNHINFISSYVPVHFAISNTGDREAVNIRVVLEIVSNDVDILLDGDEISEPRTHFFAMNDNVHQPYESAYSVDCHDDKWLIHNAYDRLHAKRTVGLDGTVYIQVKKSNTVKGKAKVFFDGQSSPHEQGFKINIKCKYHALGWYEMQKILFDHIHEKYEKK